MVQKSLIATQNNKKTYSVEEESLLMQYHSINIEKLPKPRESSFNMTRGGGGEMKILKLEA